MGLGENKKRRCILLFLKAPERGKVKTRLSEVLGNGIALGLYQNFVADIIATLQTGRYNFRICFHPPDAENKVTDWIGHEYVLVPQWGNHIGERMANAFRKTFVDGFDHVLLIGTDLPDLPATVIDDAFESLEKNAAVIGPAFDGGYYLIGFQSKTFLPAVFEKIPWGTRQVFEKTIKIFEKNQYRVHRLPKWRDIDLYEDLKCFAAENVRSKSAARNTVEYLSRIGFTTTKWRKTFDEILVKFD
jgi:rSAM/selenodomain-associated transferase 1